MYGTAKVTKENIIYYFSKYGRVKNAWISGHKGKGWVEFETANQAKQAFEDGACKDIWGSSQHEIKKNQILCRFQAEDLLVRMLVL